MYYALGVKFIRTVQFCSMLLKPYIMWRVIERQRGGSERKRERGRGRGRRASSALCCSNSQYVFEGTSTSAILEIFACFALSFEWVFPGCFAALSSLMPCSLTWQTIGQLILRLAGIPHTLIHSS